jgi:hypothetical protein
LAFNDYGRHLLISVDTRGYGGTDDIRQHEIQNELRAVLGGSAERAGLDRGTWHSQPAGDGELSVLPDDESEIRLVDDFVRELHAELRRRNRSRKPGARLRLRVAVHHGVIRTAAMGFSGKGIVEVSRLVESDVAHLALDRSDADLVLIVSQRVFEDTIAQPHTNYDPAQFRRVEVRKKELHQPAWLFLPGHDIHLVDLTLSTTPDTPEPPAERPGSGRAAQREQANIYNERIDAKYVTFGKTNVTEK